MNAKQVAAASALVLAGTVSAQTVPAEAWAGASADAASVPGAGKRSEVVADFRLFARAGLAGLQSSEAFDPFSAQARQRMALYQRRRSGPEFAQEVARIEGTQVQTAAHARAPWSSVD